MKYHYKTTIGLLEIAPHEKLPGMHRLWLGTYLIGTYKAPSAAAEAVALRKTGCEALDLKHLGLPSKLAEWEHVPISRPKNSTS